MLNNKNDKFNKYLNVLHEIEGGYSNKKSDRGGETNMGISSKQYPNINLKTLNKNTADKIYEADYYKTNGINKLPDDMAYVVFDASVNQGQGTSVLMLQEILGVKKDQIIGAETLNAINNYKGNLFEDYLDKRKERYDYTIEKNPSQEINREGWYNRLDIIRKKRKEGVI